MVFGHGGISDNTVNFLNFRICHAFQWCSLVTNKSDTTHHSFFAVVLAASRVSYSNQSSDTSGLLLYIW